MSGFWNDLPASKPSARPDLFIPPPKTGWKPPRHFPLLDNVKLLGIDTETFDPNLKTHGPGAVRKDGHIVGVSLATEDASWYFPLRHEYAPERSMNLDPAKFFMYLQDLVGKKAREYVGANIGYDLEHLRAEGVKFSPKASFHDVQYAEPLLDEESGHYSLEVLGQKYLKQGKETSLLYKWCADSFGGPATKEQAANIWRSPPSLVGPYAETDARMPLQILMEQGPRMEAEGLLDVYDLERALIPMLLDMRFAGVRVDVEKARGVARLLREKSAKASERIPGIDAWSADSIAVACEKAGIEYSMTAGGKPSFRKEWLASIDHPMMKTILEVRKYDKAANPFVESYILGSAVDGHVYGQFHPLRSDENGTVSGRFASSTPNLQNVTSRDEELAPLLRGLFIPEPGCIWVRTDYCVAPSSRVLTADFHHVRADSIRAGDELIGFDEFNPGGNTHSSKQRRKLRITKVQRTKRLKQPVYLIRTNRGTVTCSAKHRWLAKDKYSMPYEWIEAQNITPGMRIPRISTLWEEEVSRDAGWLAGMFDGEGCASNAKSGKSGRAGMTIGIAQNDGSTHDRICAQLKQRGFSYGSTRGKSYNGNAGANKMTISGGRAETWRLLGTIRPYRLLEKAKKLIDGQLLASTSLDADVVQEVIFLGEQEVVAIQTETGTLVVEGLASHNSQIEYRMLVHWAVEWALKGSEVLQQRYIDDPTTDFHQLCINMVKEITNILLDRKPAKNINFGLVFGMGRDKLIASLGVSEELGNKLYNAYFKALPSVKAAIEYASAMANREGYITTILGRRKRFEEPYENDYGRWERPHTHKALNSELQGSAADILKMGMLEAYKAGLLFNDEITTHLTVHDELDMSMRDNKRARGMLKEIVHIQETAVRCHVPLLVDVSEGKNWGECL